MCAGISLLQSLCEDGIHMENPTENFRHQVRQSACAPCVGVERCLLLCCTCLPDSCVKNQLFKLNILMHFAEHGERSSSVSISPNGLTLHSLVRNGTIWTTAQSRWRQLGDSDPLS